MFFKAFMSNVSRLLNQLSEIPHSFMAPVCLLCGFSATRYNLCGFCINQLPIVPEHCLQCARSLPVKTNFRRCGPCLSNPPPFERTFALFPYTSPIVEMISKLKFQYDLNYAKLFGDLMTQQMITAYAGQHLPDLIIPLPLHPKRLCERGFNQSLEIARPIAKKLKIRIDSGLRRIKHTAPQHALRAQARKLNVANAFHTQNSYQHLHVVVLDDVITTGFTIRACCRVIKKCGAKQIDVWCCARRM